MNETMPVIFFGHGNPMNALLDNEYTKRWAALGASLPRPAAILAVSAHWYIPGTAVTADPSPRTIHDFGGFPRELYRVQYSAPGDPALAGRVRELLSPTAVTLDTQWGLDHGTWSVLRHVFPAADVPVIQLSIDETQTPAWHYQVARRLRPLREEGVLVIGSGNIVHNLHTYAWGLHSAQPFEWAVRFEENVRSLLRESNHGPLVTYDTLGPDALLSVPTPEHYLPLVYASALADKEEPVTFPVEGIEGGSVSMLAVRFG
ncbi:MAG: 4,5-DOPA dioxygenase extradiol [Thermoanaerobaculia bacterium]